MSYENHNWDLLDGMKVKGSPEDFRALGSYWSDVSSTVSALLCDDETGVGTTAREIRALVDEYHERVQNIGTDCDSLSMLCNGYASNLETLRVSAEAAISIAESADEAYREAKTKKDNLKENDTPRAKQYQQAIDDANSDMEFADSYYSDIVEQYNIATQSFIDSYTAPKYESFASFMTSEGEIRFKQSFLEYAWEEGKKEDNMPAFQRGLHGFLTDAGPLDSRGNWKASAKSDVIFALAGAGQTFIGGYKKALSEGLDDFDSFLKGIDAIADDSTKLKGQFSAGLDKLRSAKNKITDMASKTVDEAADLFERIDSNKNNIKNITNSVKGITKNFTSSAKDFVAEGVSGLVSKAKNITPSSAGKTIIGKVGKASSALKKVPVIGSVVSAGFSYNDYYNQDVEAAQRGASESERRARAAGASTAETAAGAAGGAVGTAVGAAIGTAILPIPGVGTAVGGIVGGVVGGWVATEISDRIGLTDFAADKLGNLFK